VGGIGSVATHPDYRGRGLASAVIRDCIRIMEQSKCHLSVLWTQRHDFYRRLGYEAAGSEYLFRAKASDFARVPCECEIVPYSPEYLSAVIEIHERESLRTERTEKEYEAYLGIPKAKTLLATRGNTVTAYAVMGKGEDFRSCVHEWGGDSRDLLSLIRAFLYSSRLSEILILTPAQESEFTQALRRMRLTRVFEYLAMMRVVDVEGFSSLLGRTLSSRLGVSFQILKREKDFRVKVGKEESVLGQEQGLVRLLFGPDLPSGLLRELSQKTLHMLESALPIPLFIWGFDSV
jgi:predicted acetyltransferase